MRDRDTQRATGPSKARLPLDPRDEKTVRFREARLAKELRDRAAATASLLAPSENDLTTSQYDPRTDILKNARNNDLFRSSAQPRREAKTAFLNAYSAAKTAAEPANSARQ